MTPLKDKLIQGKVRSLVCGKVANIVQQKVQKVRRQYWTESEYKVWNIIRARVRIMYG